MYPTKITNFFSFQILFSLDVKLKLIFSEDLILKPNDLKRYGLIFSNLFQIDINSVSKTYETKEYKILCNK